MENKLDWMTVIMGIFVVGIAVMVVVEAILDIKKGGERVCVSYTETVITQSRGANGEISTNRKVYPGQGCDR